MRSLPFVALGFALATASAEAQIRIQPGGGNGGGGRIGPIIQPKIFNPPAANTPPSGGQPRVLSLPIGNQPRTNPTGQPSNPSAPIVIAPKLLPIIGGGKTSPAPGDPSPVVGPKSILPRLDIAKPFVPSNPSTTTSAGASVTPRIDPLKNPRTTIDTNPATVLKLNQTQSVQAELRKQAELSLAARNKTEKIEMDSARTQANQSLLGSLTGESKSKFESYDKARQRREQELRSQTKITSPSAIKNLNQLTSNAPATSTSLAAKSLLLSGRDNASLGKIKQSSTDPLAQSAFDKAMSARLATPGEVSYLQAKLNDPTLSVGSKTAIASALQNQSNLRRQTTFVQSLNQLNGVGPGFAGKGPGPKSDAFVGGLFGGVIGNLVFPGPGVVVPAHCDPGVVLPVPFDPTGYVGYIDYAPAVYYPPTEGLANSGSVVVQTLPCTCAPAVVDPALVAASGEVISETTPDGQPAIVIDPTSQTARLTTRYLRLINSSKEKVTVSVLIRTPDEDGNFLWLPEEPGKTEAAFTVELMPGEEKDVITGETPLHGSRARIWATGETGRTWRQFEHTDFWLVPETEEDGTHAYSAPGTETAIFNVS